MQELRQDSGQSIQQYFIYEISGEMFFANSYGDAMMVPI